MDSSASWLPVPSRYTFCALADISASRNSSTQEASQVGLALLKPLTPEGCSSSCLSKGDFALLYFLALPFDCLVERPAHTTTVTKRG